MKFRNEKSITRQVTCRVIFYRKPHLFEKRGDKKAIRIFLRTAFSIGRSSKNRTYARGVRGLCAAITPYSNVQYVLYYNSEKKSRILKHIVYK